ncbi:hypothetical protein FQN49_002267 [Arthroderma sp. PD_2]|nr:hypothetical protein FQN49_002267 [Arthroderma sp. PD_2]
MSGPILPEFEGDSSPPPPPPLPQSTPIKGLPFKVKSAPPDWHYRIPSPQPVDEPSPPPTGPYFCYGTLTDPCMIAEILKLDKEPELRPACIAGYQCKLWGQYPALLDGPPCAIVEGAVYDVESVEDGEKLAAYETGNYRPRLVYIEYIDGKEPSEQPGFSFLFVGNARDLTEGSFDLGVWLRRMGRQAALDKLDAKRTRM